MKTSPRAALCAAFTVASLTGAAFVAQTAAAPRPVTSSVEHTFWPSRETEERVHRVALRQETIADLMNEQISFEAAVERFWDMSTGDEDSLASLRLTVPGGTDEERVVAEVLLFAKVHMNINEAKYAARYANLQDEAASFRMKPYEIH